MFTRSRRPRIPLPQGWPATVKLAVIHAIALAQYTIVFTRSWAANCPIARVRLKAALDRDNQEIALLREETRIKDARMARILPQHRPHYPPMERMAILELKAARGWSLEQTARVFQVTAATISSWMNRLDEEGPDALVQLRSPVNRLPDLVRYVVGRLKTLCPAMGKAKIAETLARAGLHLGATTVGRMLKHKPRPQQPLDEMELGDKQRIVTAKYPNHIWHVDLTVVPTGAGFWVPWLPLALPQCWPFCWWVAVVVDHFSRRAMGCATFDKQPTSEEVRALLGRAISNSPRPLAGEGPGVRAGGVGQVANLSKKGPGVRAPKYIVSDKGVQFWNDGFKRWCKRKNIKPRFGAIGRHGSIAVVERFILTLKTLLACLLLVPYCRESFQRELDAIVEWYNEHRPHERLGGRTPNEVYFGRFPANRKPRYEPRSCWPRGAPCAKPWALVRGSPGAKLVLEVRFHRGRPHLPVIKLKRAA